MLAMVRHLGSTIGLSLLLAAGALTSASAQDALTPSQSEAVKKLVHDYLMEHPEVIIESLKALDARQQAGNESAQRQFIADHKDEIFNDPNTPIIGNPKGSVTIVEFFDFRCPYCKGMARELADLVRADGNIRLVYKDFPILGPTSGYAAKAALAAQRQGKYAELHLALMGYKGQLDDDMVINLARQVGLDIDLLRKDMERPEILTQIRKNEDLAMGLKITGTPGFIIGNSVVDGAMPIEKMKELVAQQRNS